MLNATPLDRRLLATVVATCSLLAASPAEGAKPAGSLLEPRSKVVGDRERARTARFDISQIMREAAPVATPLATAGVAQLPQERPDGPTLEVDGTTPSALTSRAALIPANGLWTGSATSNPNRQVGKLYYDVQPGPGEDWRHCTATAVNSENKSVVVTAGHCVFSPDPDKNGYVNGNGYWFEHVQFCPGYEYGCTLGVWYARQVFTTDSWFYGSGPSRQYDWSDDVAIVLVSPDAGRGYLVNAVGGQGITFNVASRLHRSSFGYPARDSRFPTYANTYNGEDLVYCAGYDQPDWYGRLFIPCTMTGGASGGPWITSPAANWTGYVNSVNSHKPDETSMGGPYFGNAESNLFQYARSR